MYPIFPRISVLLFAILYLSCGKLDFSNAGDPKSQAFFLTNLLRTLLTPVPSPVICNTTTRWEKSIGNGSFLVYITDAKGLPNEDIVITGFTTENLGSGKNFNFSETIGSAPFYNGFLAKLDGKTGDIVWLDYLGEVVNSSRLSVKLFSNGDIGIADDVITEQAGALSAKAAGLGSAAFMVVRYDQTGLRKWHTYFDSSDLNNSSAFEIDDLDQIHLFATLNGTAGHQTFSEFPAVTNTSQGATADTDILYGIVNGSGSPIKQTYITSSGSESPLSTARDGNVIYLGGSTTGNMNGATGHPALGFTRSFLLKIESNQSISWISYQGPGGSSTNGGVETLLLAGNQFYTLGRFSDTFGSPVSPFQGIAGSTKNYYYQKLDQNGANLWHTYLGSSSSLPEGFPIPLLYGRSNDLVYSTLLSPNAGRYTGLGAAETGTGTGGLQRVLAKIRASSGAYESVAFETNDANPQKTHYTILKEVCTGKVIRGERILPDINDSARQNFKLKVFPSTELP
ncbi:hypothetical protein [Leptospira ryugenii]|nr:hypothetical protein [Leptospira ryugenii]